MRATISGCVCTPENKDPKCPLCTAHEAQLKDSGQKRVFASGAHRDNDEKKPRFDLLPITALELVAKHYAAGAKKYGENNWRKGIPRAVFLQSALRHLFQAVRGDVDEDHIVHCAWNVLCFIETRELDLDKPTPEKQFPACPKCRSTRQLHEIGCRFHEREN